MRCNFLRSAANRGVCLGTHFCACVVFVRGVDRQIFVNSQCRFVVTDFGSFKKPGWHNDEIIKPNVRDMDAVWQRIEAHADSRVFLKHRGLCVHTAYTYVCPGYVHTGQMIYTRVQVGRRSVPVSVCSCVHADTIL